MTSQKCFSYLFVLVAILVSAGCASSALPQATAAPIPTLASSATATAASTPTATPVPPTSTPTATPRPPVITVSNTVQLKQVAAQEFKIEVQKENGAIKVTGGVYGLDWSPGSQLLAVSWTAPRNISSGITLYNDAFAPTRVISTPAVVYAPTFSSDGSLLAAGGSDKPPIVRVWKAVDGSLAYEFKGHTDSPWAQVAFSPDGKWLASGGMDKSMRVWPLADKLLTGTQPLVASYPQMVYSLAFSPDSKLLAVSSDTVWLWDVSSGKPTGSLQSPADLTFWAFFLDGDHLVTADSDDQVRFWQLVKDAKGKLAGKAIRSITAENVIGFAVNPDKTLLAMGDVRRQAIRLLDISTGEVVHELLVGGRPGKIAFRPDGAELAASVEDESKSTCTVYIWGIR